MLVCAPAQLAAETMFGALAKAYQNNSSLNYQRAGVRVTDESVPIAKSGMRPRVQGQANAGLSTTNGTDNRSASVGISLNQPIFDGFQTRNNVAAAEAGVRAAGDALYNQELTILSEAANAYMSVIRDRRIAALRAQNLEFLSEQVRAARSRFEVGEGTRTDVAQASASLQNAQAQLSAARAQVTASEAAYRQVVGEDPKTLEAASPLTKLMPKNLDRAIALGLSEHPAIRARQHEVDSAAYSVKANEGALLPQLSGSAGVSYNYSDSSPGAPSDGSRSTANVGLNLTVPIYQGGLASAQVRQSKERLGQARINVDVTRDQVRQAVVSAWSQYQAARETLVANREAISAAQLALNGVIEERSVGQRTTLDVLDAQADVTNARIQQVMTEANLVAASYAVAAAVGRLTASNLGLAVTLHQPREHYRAVKDKWYGLRTPDGR